MPSTAVRGARKGGRSARVVHDVLEATLEELAEKGFGELSIESVAARAGVAKTTVYRRWPTRGELVSAAIVAARSDDSAPIDTGSFRTDLVALLRRRVRYLETPRGRAIARALLGDIQTPEVAAIARALRRRQPLIPRAVLERAIARREWRKRLDADLLAELLTAPIHLRVLFRGQRADAAFLSKLVDVIVGGLLG